MKEPLKEDENEVNTKINVVCPSTYGSGIKYIASYFLLLLIFLWLAKPALALENEEQYFDVQKQELAAALIEFSKQSGLVFVVPYQLVSGKQSSALQGEMSPAGALSILLNGTGLVGVISGEGMQIVRQQTVEPPRQEPEESMKRKSVISSLVAFLAGTVASGYSLAQGSAGGVLEEVIVTAEKRESDIQKTAIAITAMSGADLQAQGEVQLNAALRNVPSLQIQSSPQGGSIYIRGAGSNGDSNEVDPGVGVTIDGTYSSRSEALAIGLYDVGQIEVLRGPQGTIYGRNTTAGGVSISSAKPNLDDTEVKLNAQLGNYSLRHFDGAVNLPVSDTLAFRIAGMRETRDGYFSNNGRASDATGYRGKLLFEPNDDISLLLTADYAHSEGDDTTTVPVPGGPWDDVSGWSTSDPWSVDDLHPADVVDFTYETYSGQLDWDLDWAELTIIPTYKYSHRIATGSLVTGIAFGMTVQTQDWEEDQYTGEVRLTSPAESDVKWVAGAYYLWAENLPQSGGGSFLTTRATVGGVVYDLYTSDRSAQSPTKSSALFGQVTYPISDDLRFTLGLRYTADKKNSTVQYVSVAVPGYDSGVLSIDADSNETTYKVGLEYDLDEDVMSYAQISTGYKAGGFDRGTPLRAYDPEVLLAYEVGLKSRFLDNTLQVNGSIYYYDYTDQQVQYTEPLGTYAIPEAYLPDGVVNLVSSGGKVVNSDGSTILGAELEVDWLITESDRLDFIITGSKSEYGDFSAVTTAADLVGLKGEQMANAPNFTFTPGYEHSWMLEGGELTARIQTKYSEGYWVDVRGRDRPGAYQDSYWRSDAFLTYSANTNWTASLWVKNIEDDAQATQAFPLNRLFITDPRTLGVNFSVNF